MQIMTSSGAADITAWIVALAFLAMGLAAMIRPGALGYFVGTSIASADSRNEVRAVYGGFGIAMAAALVLSVQAASLRPGIVACIALALGGMAVGRLVSAVLERPGRWPWVFCAIEAISTWALVTTHFS
jgi:hypothetical protein